MTNRPTTPSRRARWLSFLVLMFVCIGCDRVTKEVATERLQHAGPVTLAGGMVRLEYAENRGAFLGLAEGLDPELRFWLLVLGPALLLGVVAFVLLRSRGLGWLQFTALTLVLAGGLGNLVDRLVAGYVVDFMNVGVGGLRTGIFNVADMAIMAGVIGLLLLGFRKQEPEPVEV